MKPHFNARLFAVGAALALVAGCVETTETTSPSATPQTSDMRGASVLDENACLTEVAQQTANTVRVLNSQFSEANSIVMIGVGPQNAPWQCLVSQGRVAQVMSMTNEGSL